MKRWTEEEINFLRKNYPLYGKIYCADKLNRTVNSIRMKAARLKLKSSLKGQHNTINNENYLKRLIDTEYEALEPYQRSQIKIKHKHKKCGYIWKVSPNNLEKLVGCPNCSKKGISLRKTFLYIIYFPILDIYKVGTTVNWKKRKYDFGYEPKLLDLKEFNSGPEARKAEKELLKNVNLYNTGELKNGNTETFIWP